MRKLAVSTDFRVNYFLNWTRKKVIFSAKLNGNNNYVDDNVNKSNKTICNNLPRYEK